ncbi:MAG: copper resistance protein NlpE N-terminal domain-containing protein [Methylococcales bacterium]|nr:copper resistance protein NlpE N-terminal domain-containing protein [Methylococcales bacterium]
MQALTITLKQKLTLLLLSVLSMSFNPAMAKSDMQIMGEVQKAREMNRSKGDHSKHFKPVDKDQEFRGVYYGYLPCDHCAGIKMTLSLKNKKNYLLVTQYAQSSNREYYEKGKYIWDEKTRIVTLVARKDSSKRKLRIKNEGALIVLTSEEKKMKGDQDQYTLLRTDKKKSREVHIH